MEDMHRAGGVPAILGELYRVVARGRARCPRSEHQDVAGGLGRLRRLGHRRSTRAVARGNLAPDGAAVKTAGVHESVWSFEGPAPVCESQADAVEAILSGRVGAGDVVVIRYEGPRGGPGMQEMLYPTSYLKGRGLAAACALGTPMAGSPEACPGCRWGTSRRKPRRAA